MSEAAQTHLWDQDHTVEWSEANLCLCWVTRSDGRAWFGWWENKPKLERDFLLKLYREERAEADARKNGRMTPFDLVWSDICRRADEEEALIDRWALEIRAAAMAMKPMPFTPPEEFQKEYGFVPYHYAHRLACAIARAGIVIVKDPTPAPDQKMRRRTAA